MLKINGQKVLWGFATILFFYLYFSSSDVIIAAVKDSLFLCYTTVVPALFIFIVFSFYIASTSATSVIGLFLRPVLKFFNIKDKDICSYVALSIVGGFAVGGYFLSHIKSSYKISDNAVGVLSILMCNNSPAFIIVAVGSNMLGNYKLGIMLFAATAIASFVTAFIFSFIYSYRPDISAENSVSQRLTLIGSISTSVKTMLNICGVFIVAFAVCKVVSPYIGNQYIILIITSFIEVTTACVTCFDLFGKNVYFFCAILALSPFSAILQIKSFFTEKLSLKILFLSKLIQLPLSLLIFKIIVNLFPYSATVYSNADKIISTHWNSVPVSFVFFTFCIVFIIFFDKSISVFTKVKK